MIIKKRSQKPREEKKQITQQIDAGVEQTVPSDAVQPLEKAPEVIVQQQTVEEPEIDLFDIENIDFAQRQERRRGSRRRGYRRIDDRNLVSRGQEE